MIRGGISKEKRRKTRDRSQQQKGRYRIPGRRKNDRYEKKKNVIHSGEKLHGGGVDEMGHIAKKVGSKKE